MESHRRVPVGVSGLDAVLEGGLIGGRAYMVRGGPGTGKTVLGLHFLTEGIERGESVLFINFEEPTDRLRENARSLGFDVEAVAFLDLTPKGTHFAENRSYDIFTADEVEMGEITEEIVAAVDRHEPDRVFVDPLTQMRYFTPDDYQYRKEVAAFTRYLTDHGATVLFTTQTTTTFGDDDLEFISDGALEFGRAAKGRTVTVTKLRGSSFQPGSHTLRITGEGLAVYPELVPRVHRRLFEAEQVSSGVDELDALLHGGVERGTITVLSGPSGVGKTTTGSMFMREAAARGERSVIYMFEESTETFLHRSNAIGIPADEMIEGGSLRVEEVEPLAISPDEFADRVRREVEEADTKVVMIDGISGYRLSLRGDDDDLVRELHALCRYLRNMGATVLLIDETQSITGPFEVTSSRISYLGDNIVFIRYLELDGRIEKAIGVLKKRAGNFERSLRSFEITADGLVVGDPFEGLAGVLTGTPELVDD